MFALSHPRHWLNYRNDLTGAMSKREPLPRLTPDDGKHLDAHTKPTLNPTLNKD
jgi:hypothetical protein